ncbi:hypothetical protein SAMN05444671_4713 [Flavobacterium sp. CF108]|uniref:tetratricopeptide repeat protein n=1 Tax=unclassified Flavobacterium TaxID=196869 RepID=UPI0008B593AA|nr:MULTISPECIES: tetratricopeptide repeat protein [unclassified Flavobacterium]SEP23890.1 hypothetical protein SAMN04487978_0201 [Flavobacterium sp. fv08]SHI01267.1 hypothetical protein SAMN05444671_4713 [Flavobacterium sp. CF108]
MNVTDYTYLMNKPDAITENQAEALGSVLNEFPYFQSARALRLKGLYNQNSFKYNYALKVTAAHTADRSVLFDFITSETFTSIQNDFYDQKLRELLEIKVFDSEVVTFEPVVKIPGVRIDPIEESILKSIKEATTVVFEEPSKIVEKTAEVIIEESPSDQIEEIESNTFEEPVKVQEQTIEHHIAEPSIVIPTEEEILSTFKEVTAVEETTENLAAEKPIAIINEEEIFNSFKEVTEVEEKTIEPELIEEPIAAFEEEKLESSFNEVEIENITVEAIVNESVLTPSEEEILDTFKEVTETEEETIEAETEETIVTPSEEEILNTFKEVPEIEEKTADVIIEKPVTKITFFDEVVEDDEIEEVHVDPIKESIIVSIKEASTVTFEEPIIAEEPKAEAELLEFEIPKIEVSESVKEAEENLEIGKPIDFVREKHSFQEWLQLAKAEPIDRSSDAPKDAETDEKKTTETTEIVSVEEEKKKKAEIIDRFIETNPKISPIKPTMATPPISFNINEEENSYLMTETLARVYLEQKKYTKAIQAYEILILKYPEKISFFADRISDIKILQQNNNNI